MFRVDCLSRSSTLSSIYVALVRFDGILLTISPEHQNLIELPQVVMSQCTGSNREGFNVVHSAGRSPVKLDGLFNIISYDLVTKLSQAISEAQFKVSLTNLSIQMFNRLIWIISHMCLIFSPNCYSIFGLLGMPINIWPWSSFMHPK